MSGMSFLQSLFPVIRMNGSKNKKGPYTFNDDIFSSADNKKHKPLSTKLNLFPLWRDEIQKTIAKQTILRIYLLFTNEPKGPRFVECGIELDYEQFNSKAVYDALVKAFGKPAANKNKKEYVWLGKNNTVAVFKGREVAFATLDGLKIAESVDVPKQEKEDAGF